MNIKDILTYASFVPMVFGIVGLLAFGALFATTGVAGVIILLAETLHG